MSIWGLPPGVKLTTHLHIVLRVRICAAVPLRSSICLRGTDWSIFTFYHLSTYKHAVKYLRVPLFQRLVGNKLQLPIRAMHCSIVLAACNQNHSTMHIQLAISVSNWGNLTSFLFRNKRIAFIKLVPRFTLPISQENKTNYSKWAIMYVWQILNAYDRNGDYTHTHTHVSSIRVMMIDKVFIERYGWHSRPTEHSNLLGSNPMLLGWQLLKFQWNSLSQLHSSSSPKPRSCGLSKCQNIFSQHSVIP
jgi:hypothetical protein